MEDPGAWRPCSKCGVEKRLYQDFPRDDARPGGFAYQCRDCRNEYARNYYHGKRVGTEDRPRGRLPKDPLRLAIRLHTLAEAEGDIAKVAYWSKKIDDEWREKNKEILKGIEAYGDKCVDCGKTYLLQMTLRRVNKNDKRIRSNLRPVAKFWIARLHGYPKTYELVCENCYKLSKGN